MRLLTCDTSHVISNLALIYSNEIVQATSFTRAAENLQPELQKILRAEKMALTDIDLFVVIQGPGSFTGLRIGMAAIKTLAHLVKKPAVGVSTLLALIESVSGSPMLRSYTLVPVIHSSVSEFYCRIDDTEQHYDGKQLLTKLPQQSFIFGMGVKELFKSEMPEQKSPPHWWVEPTLIQPHPLAIAELGKRRFAAGKILTLDSAPNYLRASAAEERRHRGMIEKQA